MKKYIWVSFETEASSSSVHYAVRREKGCFTRDRHEPGKCSLVSLMVRFIPGSRITDCPENFDAK